MLVHHFYTFPAWINGGRYEPNLRFAALFNSPTKLCVCIFAFVNGWSFAFKTVLWKMAFGKIKKLLLNYWCIAILALILAGTVCEYNLSRSLIIKEFLGLSSSVMIFAWYVPFYCVSILILTVFQKLLNKDIKTGLVVGGIFPIIIFTVLKKLPCANEIKTLFNNLKHWFPCITVAYMSYRYCWMGKIEKLASARNRYIISFGLIVFCFIGRYFVSALDFVCCFLIVYAIINLRICPESHLGRIISLCGRNSSNMWFYTVCILEKQRETLFSLWHFLLRIQFLFISLRLLS